MTSPEAQALYRRLEREERKPIDPQIAARAVQGAIINATLSSGKRP